MLYFPPPSSINGIQSNKTRKKQEIERESEGKKVKKRARQSRDCPGQSRDCLGQTCFYTPTPLTLSVLKNKIIYTHIHKCFPRTHTYIFLNMNYNLLFYFLSIIFINLINLPTKVHIISVYEAIKSPTINISINTT